jgi:signal transduction histidine kinase
MSRQGIGTEKKPFYDIPTRPVRARWIYVAVASFPYLLGFAIERLNNNDGTGALMLVTLPVVATSWYYGIRWGLLSSLIATSLNGILLLSEGDSLFVLWPGGLMLVLVSIITGKLREGADEQLRTGTELHARERHLTMVNITVKDILNPKYPENRNYDLVSHLANIFVGDCAYLVRWNAAKEQATLVASTTSLAQPFSEIVLDANETNLIQSVLQNGSALALDDAPNSHYMIKPASTKILAPPTQSALCIPLITKEYQFGVAIITFNSPRHISAQELLYADLSGNQITLALRTVEQEARIKKRLNEAVTLSNIEHALSKTERTSPRHVLQMIVDSARELIPDTEQAVIHLFDKEEQALIPQAVSGFQEMDDTRKLKMRLGKGVAGQVIADGIVVNIADVRADPRFLQQTVPVKYRSLMVAPVQSGNERIGTISVQSSIPVSFTPDQEELLSALGTQAAIAIENARLFETTQQGLKEVNALYKITRQLVGSLETEQLMKDVVELLQQTFGYYLAEIFVIDPENEDLIVQHASGKIGELLKNQRLQAGAGIIGHAAETGEPFFTNDVDKVVFFVPHPLLPDTQSELAVPIKADNRVLGVLDIQQCPPGRLTERDLQLVNTVAEQLAVALQKAKLYSDLQTSLHQEKAVRSQLIQSERLALVGRLLASVSHELNNPLQAIQNALFLLKEERGISAQGRQDLQIVLSEAERMAALIERLRASYRPTRKEDFQFVQLNTVVEDVYALVATHLRHNQIVFEFHPDPGLAPVSVLPDQIRQVFLNLLMNAVEAMPGGGRLNVVTEQTAENEALVSIWDSGPGIDPEILPRIFDPFVTSKESGTGLGLTITYDIVQRHHGRIIAENNADGGAAFKFWLPLHGEEMR